MERIRLLLLVLLVIPSAYAWNWDSHKDIAVSVYYSLSEEIKSNLDLNIMEEASILPDKKFKDFINHGYPRSYEKASFFMEKALEDYKIKKFDEASLNIGIATHYITDSFSSPHSIKNEEYSDHKKYEDQASGNYPIIGCLDSDKNIEEIMAEGALTGLDWLKWLNTKDKEIPKEHVGKAATAAIQVINKEFSANCTDLSTEYEKVYPKKIFPIFIISILIILLSISVIKDLSSK